MIEHETQPRHLFSALLAATFVVSRLLFHWMGVRFDASGLDWYWQYLDIELLKNDLVRSVFYQHAQPPLFNLFLGAVLKVFPTAYPVAFSLLFKALSLALYFLLFRILCRIRFRAGIAYFAATLFMLSPGAVLYENWLFYTWPTAVVLAFAAHRLLRYGQTRRVADALLYFAALGIVCLTRSMFHPAYLAAAVIPLLFMASPARRRLLPGAVAVLLVVGLLFAKNLVVFGFFGSSSWMGMNLWKVVPTGGKDQQIAESRVAQTEPFSAIAEYPDAFRKVPDAFASIPAVAAETKQNGHPNLNHFGYIAVSDAYKTKAIELIAGDPAGYAGIVAKAWGLYLAPAPSYPLLSKDNLAALKGYRSWWIPADSRIWVPAGYLLLAGGLAAQLRRLSAGERTLFLFCAGTVLYVALLGNVLEHGENMRFRVQTDPLLYLAALVAARRPLERLRLRPKNRLVREMV
ncbi:hypothetical protein [Pontiella sp.]|uniref:hypothetical protein n=1 Tax=Pontiella sp. TaxID=2837462 RepID=UPI0035690D69